MTTAESLSIVIGLSERYPWVRAAAAVHPHLAKELMKIFGVYLVFEKCLLQC